MAAAPVTVFTTFFRPDRRYLDETIASVLAQSWDDFEYLIVNDGPKDEAQRIEEKFHDPRIRIITNPSRAGLVASRNLGLREARGEFVAIVDADDFCERERLSKQLEFLRAHPDHVLVGSALRFVDEDSRTLGYRVYPADDREIKARLVSINCIAQPAVMARRRALVEAGGYSDAFRLVEDYDLWLRAARMGRFHNLEEPLVAYRIHRDASKKTSAREVLRDSTRLKIHALRHYGFRPTPRSIASIAAHALLLMMPGSFVYWLFRRLFVA